MKLLSTFGAAGTLALAAVGPLANAAGSEVCVCKGKCKSTGDPHIFNFQKTTYALKVNASVLSDGVDLYSIDDFKVHLSDIDSVHNFVQKVYIDKGSGPELFFDIDTDCQADSMSDSVSDSVSDSETDSQGQRLRALGHAPIYVGPRKYFGYVINQEQAGVIKQEIQGFAECRQFQTCDEDVCPYFIDVQIFKYNTFPDDSPAVQGVDSMFINTEQALKSTGLCMEKIKTKDQGSDIGCECGGSHPPTLPFSMPSAAPSTAPTPSPTSIPSASPSSVPTPSPTVPTPSPTVPTPSPTVPTPSPTVNTLSPSQAPTPQITVTASPTPAITLSPTPSPSCPPHCLTNAPTSAPTILVPSSSPTAKTPAPSMAPTTYCPPHCRPTPSPTPGTPSASPTPGTPSASPTPATTPSPTPSPSCPPHCLTNAPTSAPTILVPSSSPTAKTPAPSMAPTTYCPPHCRPTPSPTPGTSAPSTPFRTPTTAPTTAPTPGTACQCIGTCKTYADPHVQTFDGSKYITDAAGTNITIYSVGSMELKAYIEDADTREYQKMVWLNNELLMDAETCTNGKSVPFVQTASASGVTGDIKGTIECHKGPHGCKKSACQWYLDVTFTKTDNFQSSSVSSTTDFMAIEKGIGATGVCLVSKNPPSKKPWTCSCGSS